MTDIPVRLYLTNRKCLRALAECTELVDGLLESYPWSEEAKRLKKRLWYLCHHLTLERDNEQVG